MCELVRELKELANVIITKEHEELDAIFTREDKIEYVNAVSTLQAHSEYLLKGMLRASA